MPSLESQTLPRPDSAAAQARRWWRWPWDMAATLGGIAYWGVTSADDAFARLISLGATAHEPIQDVGGGIRIGSVRDPFGNVLGVIENPHFKLTEM